MVRGRPIACVEFDWLCTSANSMMSRSYGHLLIAQWWLRQAKAKSRNTPISNQVTSVSIMTFAEDELLQYPLRRREESGRMNFINLQFRPRCEMLWMSNLRLFFQFGMYFEKHDLQYFWAIAVVTRRTRLNDVFGSVILKRVLQVCAMWDGIVLLLLHDLIRVLRFKWSVHRDAAQQQGDARDERNVMRKKANWVLLITWKCTVSTSTNICRKGSSTTRSDAISSRCSVMLRCSIADMRCVILWWALSDTPLLWALKIIPELIYDESIRLLWYASQIPCNRRRAIFCSPRQYADLLLVGKINTYPCSILREQLLSSSFPIKNYKKMPSPALIIEVVECTMQPCADCR